MTKVDNNERFFGQVDPAEQVRVFGFLQEGQQLARQVLHSGLYDHMPKDPSVRVTVYTAEILPGAVTDWHIHNGAALFLVVSGELTVEFRDESIVYGPGEVLYEPIGAIHRGANRHATEPVVAVGFLVTPPDRPDMVSMKEPW